MLDLSPSGHICGLAPIWPGGCASCGTIAYPTVEAVLASVQASSAGPTLLVEPADNIGAGAPGDGTAILRALIDVGAQRALVALCDPTAVERLALIPIGASARVALGGRGWAADPGPLEAQVTLVSRGSGAFQFEDPQNHLASAYGAGFDMGPCAVVRTAGVTVLLTSHKNPAVRSGPVSQPGHRSGRLRVDRRQGSRRPSPGLRSHRGGVLILWTRPGRARAISASSHTERLRRPVSTR
jgi:hypothetical protein